jgi:spermidine synthase
VSSLSSSRSEDSTRHEGIRTFIRFFSVETKPGERILLPLFLVSFAALFIEVLLIRWIGTEIRVFAYFQNLALIACFLGFGLCCYRAGEKKTQLFDAAAVACLIIFVELPIPQWKTILEGVSSALSYSNDAQLWSALAMLHKESPLVPFVGSVVFVTVFVFLVVSIMIPLGQWVGTYMDAAKNPVSAYTSNLAGSLAGIWVFAGLATLHLSPLVWFGVAFLLLVLIREHSNWPAVAGVLLFAASLVLLYQPSSGAAKTYWSTYQKLQVKDIGEQRYNILVNNTGYMTIANLTREFLDSHPGAKQEYAYSSYDVPFRFVDRRDRVLIIGAGAGNDAAAALRNGAGEIDAVEIDPVIARIGRVAHPEQPYSDPRVTLIVDDARSYFSKTDHKYDLIVFGMLDSHRLFSGMSSVRLDSFVYTLESFRQARSLLNYHGLVCVQHALGNEFVEHRVYWMLEDVFEAPPGVLGNNPPTFIDGPGLQDFKPAPGQMNVPRATPATDDWPFFYMAGRHMPPEYRTALALMLVIAVVLVLAFAKSKPVPVTGQFWHFFFLGAAFLLIETLSVTRFALLFGSTWIVNSVVFTAILITVLAANFSAQQTGRISTGILYALLAAGVVINYVAPLHLVLATPIIVRLAVAVVLMGAPIFWAALIFARSFRDTRDVTSAYAANLLGAVVGGLAEYSALVVGFRNQLLIALAMYALSYLAIQWESRKRSVTAPAV